MPGWCERGQTEIKRSWEQELERGGPQELGQGKPSQDRPGRWHHLAPSPGSGSLIPCPWSLAGASYFQSERPPSALIRIIHEWSYRPQSNYGNTDDTEAQNPVSSPPFSSAAAHSLAHQPVAFILRDDGKG